MRVDLGSGKRKHRDCVGIDRISYAGTDMVHDFNEPIPLADNSVEFVMAAHSLQYVSDRRKGVAVEGGKFTAGVR
ncbi:hypothetical protein [Paenibacillus donghaensis]|uniref:Methyltransferase type 11 domain-containing protein n=1 Tax=Paenibacillus donghaensis TaxID=414771 RepID=A0A2Z2KAT8_9BACL|nr:hypothetical protein [Paenibacillus donghaensis]ASA19933.1 hypothetical protein B9T62_03395 [Paenibacillus donghaensis]